jgi:hypothetical protein
MMSIAAQSATESEKKEEIQILIAACIAKHLPKDHPAREEYQSEAIKHYKAAKALGSEFPPPAF